MNASQVMTEQASTAGASNTAGSARPSDTAKPSGFWTSWCDGSRPMVPPLVQVMYFIAMAWMWYGDSLLGLLTLGFFWISCHLMSIERFMRRQATEGNGRV